jgi:hypothetical protein
MRTGTDPTFSVNATRVHVQGFDDKNWKKFTTENIFFFFLIYNSLVSSPP